METGTGWGLEVSSERRSVKDKRGLGMGMCLSRAEDGHVAFRVQRGWPCVEAHAVTLLVSSRRQRRGDP